MENLKINRGDLFYAELSGKNCTEKNSEQQGIRPVVIIQNDVGNEFSPTVIVAPITSKIRSKPRLATHIYIKGYDNRLKENSIILTEQIRVLDKKKLNYYIGKLDSVELRALDRALVVSLGINLHNIKREVSHRDNKERKLELITRKQIASYGMVAREHLKHVGNLEISNEQFGKYILTLMNLCSPAEIEEQAERIKKKN